MNLGRSFRGLTIGLALVGASVANAQQLSMWWNLSGDAAATQRSSLEVFPNTSVTLSVYMGTSGFSDAINGVSVLFGYDSANFSGAGAPAGSGLSVNLAGITFAAPFSGGSNPGDLQGGGGQNGSGNRPWGWWVGRGVNNPSTFGITNTAATKIMDVVVNVGNLSAGDVRPVTLWAPAPTDPFSGFFDSSVSAGWSPAPVMTSMNPYTGTLNVVPEPASMAALGLGALALLRRRKK